MARPKKLEKEDAVSDSIFFAELLIKEVENG